MAVKAGAIGAVVAGVAVLVAVLLFVLIILGTLMGWVVGWVISVTPLAWHVEQGFASLTGIDVTGMLPQIGSALGFIAGFISSTVYASKKDD